MADNNRSQMLIENDELKGFSGNEEKAVIPSNVKRICKNAFSNSSVKFIEFENNSELKEIDDYAFYKSEKLVGLELPNGLLKIGSHAFEGCTRMTYIVIPSSVIEIGVDAIKDTNTILAVLSNGNDEAKKIADKRNVAYITRSYERVLSLLRSFFIDQFPADSLGPRLEKTIVKRSISNCKPLKRLRFRTRERGRAVFLPVRTGRKS